MANPTRLVLLGLLVCMSIMDSRSNYLPTPKRKPKPGEVGLPSKHVMDRSSIDFTNNKTCKVPWGNCKHSFYYGEKHLDDCPGYKLNKAIRCPIENFQCTNRGPLGPNQYGGHGWCYYDYQGKTYWDWCGTGCNKCSWRCYECQPPSWLEIPVSKLPDPKCTQWCSHWGYCGDTPSHKKYGTDCTGCINEELANTGKDCWYECNERQGPCPWCGTGGSCCTQKNGWTDTSNGCDGTFGGLNNHECSIKTN